MGRGGGSSLQLVASPGPQSHHAEMTCRDDWASLPPQHPSVAGSHHPHSEAPLAQTVRSQVAKKESQRAGLSDRKSLDDTLGSEH